MYFFFNHTATTEIYTLSLHDALPISLVLASGAGAASRRSLGVAVFGGMMTGTVLAVFFVPVFFLRSEEHTSELQSQSNLVCRLLLEKKKKKSTSDMYPQYN